ncbi:hypothetical protein [Aeromicrobium duanguangcaii]|nr:hypothetical protein [Aeromicrobium duanguangcaii]MCL3837359.1 hypothetical protein [Aeromicrobium duanguangcaii]
MTIWLLLLATVAVLTTAELWLTIAHDGLGVRPAPRSHPADAFGAPRES